MKEQYGGKNRKMDLNELSENGNISAGNIMMETDDEVHFKLNSESPSGTTNNFKNVIESTIFTGNNIYLLVVVFLAMVITAIITIIRHRQIKFAAEQKEMEYLRYFHSVLPHSQIYGNLNEKFSKLDKRKNSRNSKRNSSILRRTDKVEDISDTENKLNGLTALYKQFRYSQYSSRTLSKDTDSGKEEVNDLDETEMINIEVRQTAEINANGQVTSAADKANTNIETVCQKFHFKVDTDNMQDTIVQVEDNVSEIIYKETELTEGIGDRSDDKNALKYKNESANHRVHFCLEQDGNEQEVDLTDTGSLGSTGTLTQVVLHPANKNNDELLIKKLLMESIENMKVTEL